MTINSVGHGAQAFGGIGLWGLSAFMAILLHGTMVLYFSSPTTTGASAPGIGGIDIGLGPSGRLAGKNDLSNEEQVSSQAEQGAGKPLRSDLPVKKEAVVLKKNPVEQKSRPAKEMEVPQIEKGDRPEEKRANDTAVKVTKDQMQKTGTGPSVQEQLQINLLAGGEGGLSGFGGQDQTGIGNSSTGGGSTGDIAGYYIRLQKWIQRHQNYPLKARRLKQQGVTLVKLGITSQGKLLFARVVKSSGFPLLDEAALEAIHRSSPLLPIPKHFRKDMMTLVIPMQFILT
ncbi:MAG: energy transducer TonB [Emcibacter sp.]|nr:energy transducer TonB [Emcibacter sp.]